MKNERQDYTVVLIFDRQKTKWLAVRKKRPDWQAGRFNGVGGRVEPGETPDECAYRELAEETGLGVRPQLFCRIKDREDKRFRLYCYVAFVNYVAMDGAYRAMMHAAKEDPRRETLEIVLHPLHYIGTTVCKVVKDIPWLLAMALTDEVRSGMVFDVSQDYCDFIEGGVRLPDPRETSPEELARITPGYELARLEAEGGPLG